MCHKTLCIGAATRNAGCIYLLIACLTWLIFSGSDYCWKDGLAEQITANAPLLFLMFLSGLHLVLLHLHKVVCLKYYMCLPAWLLVSSVQDTRPGVGVELEHVLHNHWSKIKVDSVICLIFDKNQFDAIISLKCKFGKTVATAQETNIARKLCIVRKINW